MRRRRHEIDERALQEVLARLADESSDVPQDALRAMARRAAARPRAVLPRTAEGGSLRPALRWGVAASAAALLVGSGLGFGVASWLTPNGGAATAEGGLGFLPSEGWNVVRSQTEASPEWPSFALAANVPLARADAIAARKRDFSGYPYETLRSLPTTGVVVIATFSLRGLNETTDEVFPRRELPLRLRDASFAPGTRLGRYELRAAVHRHNVMLTVYFGALEPSSSMLVDAQQQLDRLLVGVSPPADDVATRAGPLRPSGPAGARSGSAPTRIVDRTFVCTPPARGGIGELDVDVRHGHVDAFQRRWVPLLDVGARPSKSDTRLVFVRGMFQPWHPGRAEQWPVRGQPGVYASTRRCAPARVRVDLSSQGLPGPPIRWLKSVGCTVRGRIVVRVRALLRSAATWRRIDRWYEGARQRVTQAQVAVVSETTGQPLAYMDLGAGGGVRLWYGDRCI